MVYAWLPEAIFKMSPIENDKKPKLGFPSPSIYLSQIYNIYPQMYTFESDKSFLIKHKIMLFIKSLKDKGCCQ